MVLSVMDGNGRLTIDEIDIGRSLGACVQCLHSTSDAPTFIHRKDLFALFFFSLLFRLTEREEFRVVVMYIDDSPKSWNANRRWQLKREMLLADGLQA